MCLPGGGEEKEGTPTKAEERGKRAREKKETGLRRKGAPKANRKKKEKPRRKKTENLGSLQLASENDGFTTSSEKVQTEGTRTTKAGSETYGTPR